MSTGGRFLIVNADDFGQSPGINRGIIKAYEEGVVTSASLMVRWPASEEAAAYARMHPRLSLGLHADLGEWVYRDRTWMPIYTRVNMDDSREVEHELGEQLALFCDLVGRKPTHLDSHQHVHLRPALRRTFVACAEGLSVSLRHADGRVKYRGDFYGQTAEGSTLPEAITVEGLIKIVEALPPGITELGCHPGEGNDLKTMYRGERAKEVNVLCDPRVRAAIVARGIELCSFSNILAQ